MTVFQSAILGIIQGLTEFLPISSSGHLIVARQLLGMSQENSIAFDITVHLATLAAVVIYFRKDIWNLIRTFFKIIFLKPVEVGDRTLLFAVVVGTIPAGIAGLLFEDQIEHVFRNAHLVAYALLVGSALMWAAEYVWKKRTSVEAKPLSIGNGFIIGCFQTLALIPGMSRSGSTISGGLFLGLNRETAVRFSFVLSFPIILASALLAFRDIGLAATSISASVFIAGFLAAFVTGLGAIYFLVRYLKNHTFNLFIVYRVIVAVLILVFL